MSLQKGFIPLKKGAMLFNYLKAMDFTHRLTWFAIAGMTLGIIHDFLQ
jgi:hypothetical protein